LLIEIKEQGRNGMAEKSEAELLREAYRAEYAVVGSVWQSLQRERFFLVGIFVTTVGLLFGMFATSIRSSAANQSQTDTFMRTIPIIVLTLTIFVWLADRALQRAQKVTRARGAELERLLGLKFGLFTQMYQWKMQRLGNTELREMVALVIIFACAMAFIWMWKYREIDSAPTPVSAKETCSCNYTILLRPWTCSRNQSTIPNGKEKCHE
jgi:hypothetical protein